MDTKRVDKSWCLKLILTETYRTFALDDTVDVIEVSARELDDVVRLEDNYGRV